MRCRYDLRGLAADARCPECGLEAIESIAARVDPVIAALPPLPRPRIAAWTLLAFVLAITVAVLAKTLAWAAMHASGLPAG